MSKLIGKPQMLKEVNSSMLELLIFEQGPLSKPELARLTNLSLPTVSKLIDDLEKSRRICQVGLAGKGVGRKAMLYEINKDFGCLLVLYYHLGKYTCRLADITGKTLIETSCPLDNTTAETALSTTISAIETMLAQAPTEVKSIGVGVPGVVMPDGRLLGIPKIAAWEGFNLGRALASRYQASICVENDVNLSAVGYYHTYLNDQQDNMVYIYAGNGLGSGIIINKKLYRGSSNFSGELGFMAPLGGKRPEQDYASKGGYLEAQLGSYLGDERGGLWQADKLEQREMLINVLGAAAANHVALLNPDVVVFGGEAFLGSFGEAASESLLEEIRQLMSHYTPKESMPVITFDESGTMGIEGLILTCRGDITTQMQLVQNGGV